MKHISIDQNRRTSYHVHTHWSDGAHSIGDMVQAAALEEVRELGISDHLVLAPEGLGSISWSAPPDKLDEYVREVRDAGAGATFPVRLALEVDYFPGQTDIIRECVAPHGFDYLIGSVHFVDGFPVDDSVEHWKNLTDGEVDDICRGYWERIAEMARTGLFQIAAHLDIPKKFNRHPVADMTPLIGRALDAIAVARMIVELNTSGWEKPCREAYPSETILREALGRDISVIVTADAHSKTGLTRHFERANTLLSSLRRNGG